MGSTTMDPIRVSEVYDVAGSSVAADRSVKREPWSATERSLVWMAILATIYTLYAARSLLLPIALALVLALLLRPLVGTMTKFVPRGVAALGVMVGVLLVAVLVLLPLYRQIDELGLLDRQQLTSYMEDVKTRFSPVINWYQDLRATAEEIDSSMDGELAEGGAKEEAEAKSVAARIEQMLSDEDEEVEVAAVPQKVVQEQQPLIDRTLGFGANLVANTLLVTILLYFLLAAGDALIDNVIRLTPTVQEKKRMGQLVTKVEKGVSKYLLTISAINAGLGVAVALAMWVLGMPAPWLLGFMAFAFNFVPYVGAIVGMSIAAVVAILVFPADQSAIFGLNGQIMWGLVPATYFLLTNLEGNLVTPTLLGKTMSLNPVLVFLSLVFWGWLWGIVGALLAVPLLAVIRIWCGHFESTKGFAAILGD